jgi:ADP-ribose pyrophosphatase
MTFKVLQSKMVYHGRAFDVRQDHVLLPDENTTYLDIIEHRGAVTLVPVDQEGTVWFIRQYRHAARQSLLELPAGVMEVNETPLETAQREIQEEIGMAAGKLEELGGFFLAPGYSTETMHIFLATGLYPSVLPGDESEFLSVEKVPARQAVQLARNGTLQDAKSLVALFWVHPYLKQAGYLD